MENIKELFHKHPVESGLFITVAIVALYFAFKPSPGNAAASGELSLQNAYFQAEGIQAQSGAAIQIANINAGRDTAIATLAANTSTGNAKTWADENIAISNDNNQAAIAALPYATENNLIGSLASIASKPATTVSSKSGGFSLGPISIGGGSKTSVVQDPAALSAATYLEHLFSQDHFVGNG